MQLLGVGIRDIYILFELMPESVHMDFDISLCVSTTKNCDIAQE